MIVDAKDIILGRLSSFVAKQVLLGNDVEVINCEEAVISGKRANVFANYIRRIDRKAPGKGPYLFRRPDMFVKRTIRGMLPFKKPRGQEAFKRIRCYVGIPEDLKSEKIIKIDATSEKIILTDHFKVKDVCKAIGGK